MKREIVRVRKSLLTVWDMAVTLIVLKMAYNISQSLPFDFGESQSANYFYISLIIAGTYVLTGRLLNIYELSRNPLNLAMRSMGAVWFAVMISLGVLRLAQDSSVSSLFLIVFGVLNTGAVIMLRMVQKLRFRLASRTLNKRRRIMIVGDDQLVSRLAAELNGDPEVNFTVVGALCPSDNAQCNAAMENVPMLGTLEDIIGKVIENAVDEVVISGGREILAKVSPYLSDLERMGVTVSLYLDFYEFRFSRTYVSKLNDIPLISFYTVQLTSFQKALKRSMDIAGALVGLAICGVATLVVAPLIWLEDKGPIFFSQVRVGMNGREFKIYKFRSMYQDAEKQKEKLMQYNEMQGHMFKMKDDPRVTRIGRFIRKTSIDELPQFLNILKGDMSLVGTRPPTVNEVKHYELHHRRRISIQPGLTGMWQTSGRSDMLDFEAVVKLDTEYIDNWSLWMDIKLILKTVKVVLFGKGSY